MDSTVIKSRLLRNLSNLPGWRAKEKIVVFESDDWGSIRIPSKAAADRMEAEGLDLKGGDSKRYNLYDTLASPEDLETLFELLSSFKDKNNNPCVFTVVCVVANPDFQKIRENDFRKYFYESFTTTLNRYYKNNKSFELWKQGIKERIFLPQFHGREHLNVAEWMRALQRGDREAHIGFENGFWGFNNKPFKGFQSTYQAAFDLYDPDDLRIQKIAIKEGLELFNDLFGYKASFFIPPNGPFNNSLEETAAVYGIKYMSVSKIQSEPLGYGKYRRVIHWLGEQNSHHQRYMVRNCFFEPSQPGKDWVNSCLKEIEIAFRWRKPAVISSHRVNYIGVHDERNRVNGLTQLRLLVETLLKKWPEVEFFTSNQLGDLITKENNVVEF